MSKVLLKGDEHYKEFDSKRKEYSKWQYEMSKYCIDFQLEYIKNNNIDKVYCLGDMIDNYGTSDITLSLVDRFWGGVTSINDKIEKVIINGNHELSKTAQNRIYYWDVMKDYYKEKYNLNVYDFEEVKDINGEVDLFCGHKNIHKLQNLKKRYRYIFSHLRSSDGNAYYSDEINMVIPKACASKVYLSDIHSNLEYDNVVYTGASTFTHFPKFNEEESELNSIPSFIVLDTEKGTHERVYIFDKNSKYQKKLKHIKLEDLDNLEEVIDEIRQDNLENKSFYKIRVYGKKFMLDKVKRFLREQKDTDSFCITEYINLSMLDSNPQQINYNKLVKMCLNSEGLSKDMLEYILKTNEDKSLEEKIVSVYSTIESLVER